MTLKSNAFYLLFYMVCINGMSMIFYDAGIQPMTITPSWNQTGLDEALDANATLSSYSWDVAYNDFVFGTLSFLGKIGSLIYDGFPVMLQKANVPAFIYEPLNTIWRFLWFITIILGLIGGQNV